MAIPKSLIWRRSETSKPTERPEIAANRAHNPHKTEGVLLRPERPERRDRAHLPEPVPQPESHPVHARPEAVCQAVCGFVGLGQE